MNELPQIVYCHCQYASIIPENTKQKVLSHLTEKGTEFLAVPDLCEMAACNDPMLNTLAGQNHLSIVACYPRAVKALFESVGEGLDLEDISILNMRTETAESIIKTISQIK